MEERIELAHIPAYGMMKEGLGRVLLASEVTLIEQKDFETGNIAKNYYSTPDLIELVVDADVFIGERLRESEREAVRQADLAYFDAFLSELAAELGYEEENDFLIPDIDELIEQEQNEDGKVNGDYSPDSVHAGDALATIERLSDAEEAADDEDTTDADTDGGESDPKGARGFGSLIPEDRG